MASSASARKVCERLVAEARVLGEAAALVQAALEGDDPLEDALARAGGPVAAAPAPAGLPAVWLERVAVRGFRGIGPDVVLELSPGPGLVLVVGRNGSGKSSLAEALEVLLTGGLAGRGAEGRAGWRNLAEPGTRVAATFAVEGGASVTIERAWADAADLARSTAEVRRGAETVDGGLAALGWDAALATWRPLLGTAELQRTVDGGPPVLFEAFRGLLGLEEVVAAERRLAEARRRERRRLDEVKEAGRAVLDRLASVDDPRAAEARALLEARRWDLDRLERVADEAPRAPAARGESHRIATADVLAAALAWHDEHGRGACPACGAGVLDASWRARAEAALREAEAARRAAEAADPWASVRLALAELVRRAREARAGAERLKRLERAEKWLRAVEDQLRDEAFDPLAIRARAIWDALREASSVELSEVRLAGNAAQRRVEVDVAVDGRASGALAVMSRGELDALALALFLPRATEAASPFRFVIVDDPVRSMDSARVDGLARLLVEEARDRQVLVLTHDPRLEEALRRLRLPARVVQVSRRAGSVVELEEVRGAGAE